MSQNTREGKPNIFPFMCYQDAPAAIDWLGTTFGFEKLMVVPGPDGTISHAEMMAGPGIIMLGSMKNDELGMRSPRDLHGVTQGIYVYVEDIDAHYDRTTSAGADIVRELNDTDYGSREYMARDPEGHLWGFGNYLPNTNH